MELVIYRDKETNKILNYHTKNERCTQGALDSFNAREEKSFAEFVNLEENSVAEYFYNLKTTTIQEEYKNLRDLQDTLDSISSEIEDRLTLVERWIEENKEKE